MFGFSGVIHKISSMSEFIGESSFLIDLNEINGLQKALRDLLVNKPSRVEIQKSAILQSKDFPWEKTTQTTLDVYRRVLKGE